MTPSPDTSEEEPKQTTPPPPLPEPQPVIADEKKQPDPVQEPRVFAVSVLEKQTNVLSDPLSSQPEHQQQPEDYDPSIGAKPYSPFYRHATPSSKLVRLASQRKRSKSIPLGVGSPIDDIEGQRPPWQRLYDVEEGQSDGRDSKTKLKLWKQKKRYCDCLSGLSKGQRMAVKIAIAVVLLGSMVAVALGTTAAARVIGGTGGADVGNYASIPTENTATITVNEDFKDDHSCELEHEVMVYTPGHGHHKRVAGRPDPSVIGGPSGDDIGNTFGAATVNSLSSEVNEAYKDDHSVDNDKTAIIKPHHHRRGDNFPQFTSSATESYVDDHSVDVDKNTIAKPHWRRQHASVLGGPGGDDVAFLAYVNEFSSSFTGKEHPASGFQHPPTHDARGDPATVIGGDSGDDIGNAADVPTVNSFMSTFDGKYQDDHSVDVDKTFTVEPHKVRAVRPGHYDDGATVIGGPSGNGFAAASVNTINTETNEPLPLDDHIHPPSRIPRATAPSSRLFTLARKIPPPAPAQHEYKSESDSECIKAHQVAHTVTSAHTAVETANHSPWPQPAHSEAQQPSSSQYPAAGIPFTPEGPEQAPADPQYESEHDSSNSDSRGWIELPVTSSEYQFLSQGGDQSGEWSFPSPSCLNEQHNNKAGHSLAASEVYHGAESSHAAASSHMQYQHSDTAFGAFGAYHAPAAPANIVAEASSFSVIPVFVPSRTPWAHGDGSVIVASPSTPVSPVFRVHDAAVPTGASAEQNHRPS
ncbi:hypothetical protein BDW66DRAFT_148926 [Aspergillus desertorum]